jgi:hypothetical protein
MRVFSGLFLGACFTLGMALAALFFVLLRSSLPHLTGVGQKERIKRPAFLSSIQD